jgi:hypothetical protein
LFDCDDNTTGAPGHAVFSAVLKPTLTISKEAGAS